MVCSCVSEAFLSQLAHWAGAFPVSVACSMKQLGVFLLPLGGMLVHCRSLPSNLLGFPQQFTGTHLYSWVERGTVRAKCLAQEHNIMSPARARTRTARSGDERTNHEATAPPIACSYGIPSKCFFAANNILLMLSMEDICLQTLFLLFKCSKR